MKRRTTTETLLPALLSGFAGAAAITLAHETARQLVPGTSPRMDVLGRRAIAKASRALGYRPPRRGQQGLALVGDLVSNTLYYALVGLGNRRRAWTKGGLLGAAAGAGAIALPPLMGLGRWPRGITTQSKVATFALYTLGGLVSAATFKALSRSSRARLGLSSERPQLACLRELLEDIQFGMLTTADSGTAQLHSRPMALASQLDDHGDVYFFTDAQAPKVGDVHREPHVNVALANPHDQCYVSLSGTAELVRDRERMAELWSGAYRAWFPQGLDDPNLALLKVHVERAEYWQSSSQPLVYAFGLAQAAITGKRAQVGENRKLDLERELHPAGR